MAANLAQLALVNGVGNNSLHDNPDKLQQHGVELFSAGDNKLPLVAGCSTWLACELVSEPHNQQSYDLFIGEVTAAWADQRIFRNGHWLFEQADARWKSLHHVAGGHYYAIGDAVES